MIPAGGVDDDVAHAVAGVDLHEVHRADDPAGRADGACHEPKDALGVLELDADGERYWALGVALTGRGSSVVWRDGMLGGACDRASQGS